MKRTAVVSAATVLALLVVPAGPPAKGKAPKKPAPGTVFRLRPSYPKYVTCDIEFRDPTGKKWPQFFYGKPGAEGSYRYDKQRPSAGFSIRCDSMCQKNGDQSRRILGELVKQGKEGVEPPIVTFTVKSIGPFNEKTVAYTDGRGRKRSRTYEYAVFKAELEVSNRAGGDGRKLPVEAEATFRYKASRKGSSLIDYVYIDARLTIKGEDLGLTDEGSTGEIRVRAGMSAYVRPGR